MGDRDRIAKWLDDNPSSKSLPLWLRCGESVNPDGFGSRSGSTTAEFRFGYTGRELDGETGLYYYRARYYDPSAGRFISEDPLGFGAGDTNLYRYVGNSPTNFTDPTGTTISGWADDVLNGADQFFAGVANVASFGLTNRIREQFYGQVATQNQEGLLYNLGTGVGLFATLALNPAGPGIAIAKSFASGYQKFATAYGIADSTKNILTGQGSAWDLLNLAPAAGFALHNRKAIGGVLSKAADAGGDALWRGIDRVLGIEQPQLVLATQRRAASATTRVDDVASHQFAMMTGKEESSIPGLDTFIQQIGGDQNLIARDIDVITRDINGLNIDSLFKDKSANAVFDFFQDLRDEFISRGIIVNSKKQFQAQYSLFDVNTTKVKGTFVMKSGSGGIITNPLWLSSSYGYNLNLLK